MPLKLSSSEPSLATNQMKDKSKDNKAQINVSKSISVVKVFGDNNKYIDDCIFCLEAIEANETIIQLICGHYYHHKCMTQWLSKSFSCPNCRRVVADNPYYKQSEVTDLEAEMDELLANIRATTLEDIDINTIQENAENDGTLWSDEAIDFIRRYDQQIRQFIEADDEDNDDWFEQEVED